MVENGSKSIALFRQPQGNLLKEDGLKKAVDAVRIKLGPADSDGPRKVVLVLMDAEKACPKELAPRLLEWAKQARSDADISVVLPNPMFETWFVAAAASLAGVNGLPADLQTPDDPEGQRQGKSWIKKKLPQLKYSETVDQPRFAARFDLSLCRRNSPSFDKLCRELEKWIAQPLTSSTSSSATDPKPSSDEGASGNE